MRSWTPRERGLGFALALAAVAAVAVPAGASPDGRGDLPSPIVDRLTDAERQKMDELAECMDEQGVAPPPPGRIGPGEAPPPRGDVLKRAAEECGLPAPPEVATRPFMLPANEMAEHRDELDARLRECAVPAH